MKSIKSLLIGIMLLSVLPITAQQAFKQLMRETSPEFFQSEEARRIGNQLLLYQRVTGGWPKNIDMAKPLSDKEREKIAADKHKHNDSTTDNDATTLQIYFLSRLYQANSRRSRSCDDLLWSSRRIRRRSRLTTNRKSRTHQRLAPRY